MSVGGGQGCLAVNVRSTPNSDRKFKGLASVATGQEHPSTPSECQFQWSLDRDRLP
jgi:hypothetical protein